MLGKIILLGEFVKLDRLNSPYKTVPHVQTIIFNRKKRKETKNTHLRLRDGDLLLASRSLAVADAY